MATVQTLQQSALLAFGMSQDNQRFMDDFYGALNDSQNDIVNSRSGKWGFLRTTATITATHAVRTTALPADFGVFFDVPGAIVIATPSANLGTVIDLKTFEDWQTNFFDDGSEEGTPAYCYILGNSIYWSQIPDATYTVNISYYKSPTEINDTSSSITIPTAYHELLKKCVWIRLQSAGYSSVQELQITDADIQRLMGKAATSDIAKYGSFTMNLNSTTYKRRTI
jgi:hypothetical protein